MYTGMWLNIEYAHYFFNELVKGYLTEIEYVVFIRYNIKS